jgi:hypothetical protein
MWAMLKRFRRYVSGKKFIYSEVQALVITTRRKDFAFEELNGLSDDDQFIFVFDREFYSIYSDWKPERSKSEKP